jgi:hypothetical protein
MASHGKISLQYHLQPEKAEWGKFSSVTALSQADVHSVVLLCMKRLKQKQKSTNIYIYILIKNIYIYIYIYIYVVAYHGSIGIYSPLPSRPVDAPEKSCG